MKRVLYVFLSFIMLLSAFCVNSFAIKADDVMIIYVSPNGNDENSGSEENPLGSFIGVRDRIREIKKSSGLPKGGITVLFRGGEYFWNETIILSEEDSGTADSPIRYCAYPGEEPCFTGGTRIPGEMFSRVKDEAVLGKLRGGKQTRENVRQINIKDFFTEFKNKHNLGETSMLDWYPYCYDVNSVSYSTYSDFKKLYTNNVFNGDEQAALEYMSQFGPTDRSGSLKRSVYSIGDEPALWAARYPNKEVGEGGVKENPYPVYMKLGKVIQSPWTANPTDPELTGIAHYSDDRISQYAGYEDVWIDQYSTIFYHDMLRLKKIDPINKTIETFVRPTTNWVEEAEFCIFNILEELDAPGEMYIDKNTGMMYIYPNGDLDNSFLNISVFTGNWMLETRGASFIEFNGISFENTQGGGLMIDGGDSISINYCNLRDIGRSAVSLGDGSKLEYWQLPNEWRIARRPQDETYNDVIMEYYNYYMDEKRSVDVTGKNHKFYGSHIKNTGLSGVSVTGGNSWRDEDCNYVIENCDITYVGVYKPTYEAAINFGNTFGVKIINNKFAHAPGQLINGYLLKGEIAYNYLYDAMSYMRDQGMVYLNYTVMGLDVNIHNNWFRQIPEDDHKPPYHTQRFGIYFDDGVTQGLQIKNNIFQDMTSAMQKPVVNSDVTGNIFIECVDLHSKYTSAMTSTKELFMYPVIDEENFWHNQANEAMTANLPATWREWSYILALLPVHAEGEVGEHYQKLWREKYPRIMNYLDIIESGAHKGNFFVNIQNNLIVKRERKDWFANNFKFEDIEQYPASGNEIKNNVYVDNNDCFVDYYNEDFTLKESFAKKYNLKSIDQSEIGLRNDVTGTELYKQLFDDLSDILVVENKGVPNGVIALKVGYSSAISKGEKINIDENTDITPVIINSRTLVPLRFIAENIGGEVLYDDETKLITILLEGKKITHTIGENELYIDGEIKVISDVSSQITDGRTFLPLRVVCEEIFNKKVFWDESGIIVIGDDESVSDNKIITDIKNILK